MTPSNTKCKIRMASEKDIPSIVQITKANKHYWSDQVDGAEALARQLDRTSNFILVSETPTNEINGFIIGVWDGARAMITKLSVLPSDQYNGVGTGLVRASVEMFEEMGAPTIGVFAADGTRPEHEENDSTPFWNKMGFEYIPARLMIKFNIQGDMEEYEEDSK